VGPSVHHLGDDCGPPWSRIFFHIQGTATSSPGPFQTLYRCSAKWDILAPRCLCVDKLETPIETERTLAESWSRGSRSQKFG
jgi:hypothetical protein